MPMTCPSSRLPGTPAQVVIPALFTLIDVQPVDVLGGPSPVPEFLRLLADVVEIESRLFPIGILDFPPATARFAGRFAGWPISAIWQLRLASCRGEHSCPGGAWLPLDNLDGHLPSECVKSLDSSLVNSLAGR